ncbi:MAG: SDR family oxidoreductase [Granulosicoccus sp.]
MTSQHESVIVTGSSRGIGRACCDTLAERGISCVSLSRTRPKHLPDTETHYCVDLSDLRSTATVLAKLLREHSVSALICNAGRGDIGSLENFSVDQINDSITLNLISPLIISRLCAPAFRARDRSNIVFIGSTSAVAGARYGSVYSAAKFGLRGIAQSLHYELAGANCHVGIVNPGMVRTGFFETLDFEPGPEQAHALQAEQVADAVMSLLLAPDNALISEILIQPPHHVVRKKSAKK